MRALRMVGRYTRSELAASSGVSEGGIRDYERGRRSPSLDAAARLAHALGKSPNDWNGCLDLSGCQRLPAREPRVGARLSRAVAL
ncbi:MAG: helix-turn-helix transcriptional regulator [Gemmataceae bacterium]